MPVTLADQLMDKHLNAFAGQQVQKADDMASDGPQQDKHQRGPASVFAAKPAATDSNDTVK